MAVTVVIDGLRAQDTHVVVDPLAELATMLHAVTHGDHHPRARAVRENLHRSRNDELFALATYFRPLYGAIRARYLMPLSADVSDDLDSRIADLEELDLGTFVAHSVVSFVEFSTGIATPDLLHNRPAQAEIIERVGRISQSRVELARDIFEQPADALARLVGFLRAASTEWFAPEWEKVGPVLRAERSRRRSRISERGPSALVEAVPIATEAFGPHRIVFDKVNHAYVPPRPEGLLLVPSYFLSPHLIVKSDAGHPAVVSYDVEPIGSDVAEVTARRIAVLQDPTRIEICRAILRTPRTTMDLATKMRVGAPQMSRHLRALREAELVTVERRGRYVFYALDSRAIATIGTQLLAHLHR